MTADQNTTSTMTEALARLKPYVLAILRKGENYNNPETKTIIQTEHLPHTFKQIENGILSIAMPMREENSEIAAIGIYNTTDKAEIRKWLDNDPAVIKGIFTFDLLNCIGMQGDGLK
jgi:uncharacterized protein YciI